MVEPITTWAVGEAEVAVKVAVSEVILPTVVDLGTVITDEVVLLDLVPEDRKDSGTAVEDIIISNTISNISRLIQTLHHSVAATRASRTQEEVDTIVLAYIQCVMVVALHLPASPVRRMRIVGL